MIFSSQLGKLDGLSTEQSLKTVSNHLRKMQEELEYRLSVLDSSNISEIDASETNIFANGQNINNILSDQNGNMSALQQTVDGFKQQVSDYEKGYSEWSQTVEGFRGTVSDYGNKVSQYQQTVDGFQNTVTDYTNGYSAWSQTVDGFTSQVKNYTDQVTSYQQTVNSFNWQVQNFSEQIGHALRLDSSGFYITDQSGNIVTISGGQIDASTIRVNNLYGSTIYLKSQYYGSYYDAGAFSVTGSASADFAVDLTSYGALRMTASYGDAYIGSNNSFVTLSGPLGISCQGNLRPSGDGTYSLGSSYYKWSQLYASTSTISTSDLAKKNSVVYGLDDYEEFFKKLQPLSYKFNDGTSGRRHTGFGSQDVERALGESGHTSLDFAGFIKSPKVDEDEKEIPGEYDYALRYEEFVALNTHMIQKLMGRVEELEQRVAELEAKKE